MTRPRMTRKKEKTCGDCRKHLVRGECPRAEYAGREDNLAACWPKDPICEKFEPKKHIREKKKREKKPKPIFKDSGISAKKKGGMRIVFSEEKIIGAYNALEIIFPNKKTQTAAKIFVEWLKGKDGQASKTAVSIFADELQNGRLHDNGIHFKYSKRNLYMTVLRTLVSTDKSHRY